MVFIKKKRAGMQMHVRPCYCMKKLLQRAAQHAVEALDEINGLFGLHDRIGDKTCVSDLVYWMNGSLDLHNIVNVPFKH